MNIVITRQQRPKMIFNVFCAIRASKHIYLSNDRLPKKPLAQQCWQPIVTAQTVKISSHKEQKTYILATPHRHNITVINAKEQQ